MKTKRSGNTLVTSVSVSQQFADLIGQYNLSPTECFRRGVAVTLFDLGVSMYQSGKNEERFNYVKEFMKKIEEDEKLNEQFEKIKLFEDLKEKFKDIKKLIDVIEEEKKE